VPAEKSGVYEIQIPSGALASETFTFASNALSREESDLTKCATGRWGNWTDTGTGPEGYRNVAWAPLLLALLVLALHLAFTARLSSA
jgi:hypothetical protein